MAKNELDYKFDSSSNKKGKKNKNGFAPKRNSQRKKMVKKMKRQSMLEKVTQLVLFLVVVASVVVVGYVSFNGPIKLKENGKTTWVNPSNATPRVGDIVISTENKDSIGTRLFESGIVPEGIIQGEVLGGPYGLLNGQDGRWTVSDNGKTRETNVYLGEHEPSLNKEYIIRCESGNCEVGKDYLVKAEFVKGAIKDSK